MIAVLLISSTAQAEGMIDITPFVAANVAYDDNVFRFSNPEQAKAAFGSEVTSDVIKRVDLGVNVNVNLSRQVFTLASSINESRYDRFTILDNIGKSNRLGWSWRLGNHLYGELNASESEAIAGFTEIRQPVKNLRTISSRNGSFNWNLHPDWTINASGGQSKIENGLANFNFANREDEFLETGMRYKNPQGTQLGLAYRILDSDFPDRSSSFITFLGDESIRKDMIIQAAWQPTAKTKLAVRISHVDIKFKDIPQRDFKGVSQRWDLDYVLTGKTMINFTAYQDVGPAEEALSNYIESKGFGLNPVWNPTSKISVRAGWGYEERDFLGNPGVLLNDSNRYDESTIANLSLSYLPTRKSLVQIQYQGQNRKSNVTNFVFKFNTINLTMRYDF
ncbi:MAG: outer membrane beta-barrel protein [Methylotenera sp.]|nr:outer membrane beta-barrel protein [Methylotenera sp.]